MDAVWKETRVTRVPGSRARTARLGPRLMVLAATSSLGAACIHAAVAPAHFEASALLGVLFVAAAFGQGVWPALVLARPSARVMAAGAGGNLAVLAAWAASRTVGLPIGPHSRTPEPVAALDAGAVLLELTVAVACLLLARLDAHRAPHGIRLFAAISATVVAGLVGAALVADSSRGHEHGAPSPAPPLHAH